MRQRVGWFLALALLSGCSFKAPDANKPLGCACDRRPHAFAHCTFDRCEFAGL